ncbi:WAP four-disulfide core domain protein 2-like [Nymphalis io]|uniref:WAP four-disulfide core domain protein 2-like n=1 Tax=Inachis io TaxID=171585 RepID=UPI00216AA5F5|nr:WAP four-disulfide core domain protein 2-like [Nymphalis io]
MMEDKMLRLCFLVIATSVALASCRGSCPPTLSVDICEATCGPQAPCNSTTLCCPTACGGAMCVDPMTERHFVTLVKKGRCPEYPRGVWICSHTCTGDSDCPRSLKCCPNRCGAQTCQRPDADEDMPQPI